MKLAISHELRGENLDRNRAVQSSVHRPENFAHPARADPCLNAIGAQCFMGRHRQTFYNRDESEARQILREGGEPCELLRPRFTGGASRDQAFPEPERGKASLTRMI